MSLDHDPALVAKVAEALEDRDACEHERADYDRHGAWVDCAECTARVVLDALDVPGIVRAAKAEALREAASLIAAERHSEVRRLGPEKCSTSPLLSNWIGGFSAAEGVVTRRAAEIDPEEADDDA